MFMKEGTRGQLLTESSLHWGTGLGQLDRLEKCLSQQSPKRITAAANYKHSKRCALLRCGSSGDFVSLTWDRTTAHRRLHLSDDNRTATLLGETETYPIHQYRPQSTQVLGSTPLTGRCYFEVLWYDWVDISLAHKPTTNTDRRRTLQETFTQPLFPGFGVWVVYAQRSVGNSGTLLSSPPDFPIEVTSKQKGSHS
uniref:SPRY-associated domain-containing protein n=1 Tax=Knipowitschia caucasica TaxID=637954 RepID=A0AAV2KUJ4_KNICA